VTGGLVILSTVLRKHRSMEKSLSVGTLSISCQPVICKGPSGDSNTAETGDMWCKQVDLHGIRTVTEAEFGFAKKITKRYGVQN